MTLYSYLQTCTIFNDDVGIKKEVIYQAAVLLKFSSHV
jgi:hypothetical protein